MKPIILGEATDLDEINKKNLANLNGLVLRPKSISDLDFILNQNKRLKVNAIYAPYSGDRGRDTLMELQNLLDYGRLKDFVTLIAKVNDIGKEQRSKVLLILRGIISDSQFTEMGFMSVRTCIVHALNSNPFVEIGIENSCILEADNHQIYSSNNFGINTINLVKKFKDKRIGWVMNVKNSMKTLEIFDKLNIYSQDCFEEEYFEGESLCKLVKVSGWNLDDNFEMHHRLSDKQLAVIYHICDGINDGTLNCPVCIESSGLSKEEHEVLLNQLLSITANSEELHEQFVKGMYKTSYPFGITFGEENMKGAVNIG